ncbi:pelota [Cerioporus squamosus]|nr:pelota [Cerioporus squamosus]
MKLINKHIEKDRSGHVTVCPEDDEDMWHLYNLIQEGDRVRAPAIRRIQNVSTTGTVDSKRIRLNLTLAVTKVTWSPSAAPLADSGVANSAAGATPAATATVEISGRVAEENHHVKLGAFHTLDIEANRNVRIEKDAGGWDSVALGRVEESCVPGRGAEVAAIVCGEGTAIFCLLSEHMTVVLQRLEVSIPRKISSQSSAHEKGLARFYQNLYTSFLRHVPYSSPSLRAIVIASPEASRTSNKALLTARNKFIKVHVNSPHVHSLVEALKSPEIASQMKETKFAREGIMLDRFFKMLASDEMRAWYGPDHLFRSSDAALRKKYVGIVEDVKQKGGEVLIFSSMHESGQLDWNCCNINLPLDVEVVEAEEREAKEEDERRKAEEGEAEHAS